MLEASLLCTYISSFLILPYIIPFYCSIKMYLVAAQLENLKSQFKGRKLSSSRSKVAYCAAVFILHRNSFSARLSWNIKDEKHNEMIVFIATRKILKIYGNEGNLEKKFVLQMICILCWLAFFLVFSIILYYED